MREDQGDKSLDVLTHTRTRNTTNSPTKIYFRMLVQSTISMASFPSKQGCYNRTIQSTNQSKGLQSFQSVKISVSRLIYFLLFVHFSSPFSCVFFVFEKKITQKVSNSSFISFHVASDSGKCCSYHSIFRFDKRKWQNPSF